MAIYKYKYEAPANAVRYEGGIKRIENPCSEILVEHFYIDELEVGEYYQCYPSGLTWLCEDVDACNETTKRYYPQSGKTFINTGAGPFIKVNFNETKGEDKMENKLYEINLAGTITYGTYLATNSQSQWVMEEKGTGRIITVDKGQASEVLPHSIAVRFHDGGKTYHYLADANKFLKGFYIVNGISGSYGIAEVTAVDTKSKAANKEFTPVAKLSVDKLTTSED